MKLFEYGGLIVEPGDDPETVKAALADLKKGGAGSGNFGHSGRQGEVGGSGEGGGGGRSDAEHLSRLTQAASDAKARGNLGAAKEWANNARNLKGNDETLKQDARMASMSIQDKEQAKEQNARDVARAVGPGTEKDYQQAAISVFQQTGVTSRGSASLRSTLARKDFEKVASHIRDTIPAEHREGTARAAAEQLAKTNPLFNTERFVNASTGKGSTSPGRLGHTSSTAAGIRAAAGKQQGIPEFGDPRSEWYYGKKGTGIADMIKMGVVKIRGAANGN